MNPRSSRRRWGKPPPSTHSPTTTTHPHTNQPPHKSCQIPAWMKLEKSNKNWKISGSKQLKNCCIEAEKRLIGKRSRGYWFSARMSVFEGSKVCVCVCVCVTFSGRYDKMKNGLFVFFTRLAWYRMVCFAPCWAGVCDARGSKSLLTIGDCVNFSCEFEVSVVSSYAKQFLWKHFRRFSRLHPEPSLPSTWFLIGLSDDLRSEFYTV